MRSAALLLVVTAAVGCRKVEVPPTRDELLARAAEQRGPQLKAIATKVEAIAAHLGDAPSAASGFELPPGETLRLDKNATFVSAEDLPKLHNLHSVQELWFDAKEPLRAKSDVDLLRMFIVAGADDSRRRWLHQNMSSDSTTDGRMPDDLALLEHMASHMAGLRYVAVVRRTVGERIAKDERGQFIGDFLRFRADVMLWDLQDARWRGARSLWIDDRRGDPGDGTMWVNRNGARVDKYGHLEGLGVEGADRREVTNRSIGKAVRLVIERNRDLEARPFFGVGTANDLDGLTQYLKERQVP